MAVERPTFSESWYRVADLRPRLRSSVQVSRQHFRGKMWHVVHDPSNNQFFRLNEPAYRFVGMLNGRRPVAEAWQICNEQLGDDAPTQGEAIQLLGQLYTSNLLQTELPGDAESLFNRFRKRRMREVQGFLMNLLFVRIPLLDPDRILDRWVGIVGRLFTWYGLAAWIVLLGAGFYFLAGRTGELTDRASGVLAPENLPLLYVSMALIKVFHEFGHAFACKRCGQFEGGVGEVHEMGVMFLVFAPLPYMDASSAWAFRSKWRRVLVGAAGMIVELAVASVAAMVWANTAKGTAVNAICYNVMFIASVSTVLFNGNPLLRYDAYYMLSDLLEIPNLSQRSRFYIYYLVRKYAWGVRNLQNPAHTRGERGWLAVYAIASMLYRIVVCVAILLFVADKLFLLGAVLAIAAVIAWVCVPIAKFARYLATSGELARVRSRAVTSTVLTAAVILGCVGLIPAPDYYRAEGIVEPVELAVVYAGADGFVRKVLPTGRLVSTTGPVLADAVNRDLEAKRDELEAEHRRLTVQRRLKQTEELAAAQILGEQIAALEDQIGRVNEELAALNVLAPAGGTWICPDSRKYQGAYLHRGDPIGLVASLDHVFVRATAGQQVAAMLFEECRGEVEVRVKGRADLEFSGELQKIYPAGDERLPSAALGYTVGGAIQTEAEDRSGTKASERFFEIQIAPDPNWSQRLLVGQRVVVRFRMQDKSLAAQAWKSILQLVQRRFHI